MATSEYSRLPLLIDTIRNINPKSVLDVGVGFGKVGLIVREYLECWAHRYNPSQWKIQLDGIEIYPKYHNGSFQNIVYNKIYYENAYHLQKYLPKNAKYDLITTFDIIEHFHKAKGLDLLGNKLKKYGNAILVTIPIGKGWLWDWKGENKHQSHLSEWKISEIENLGYKTLDLFDQPNNRQIGICLWTNSSAELERATISNSNRSKSIYYNNSKKAVNIQKKKTDDRINVLHLARNAVAMAPLRISRALSKYSEFINSQLIDCTVNNIGFDHDIVYDGSDQAKKAFQELYDWCDIIHVHSTGVEKVFDIKMLRKKKCIIQWHNPIRPRVDIDTHGYDKTLVVAQHQVVDYPASYIVPNIIDIRENYYMPAYKNNRPPVVVLSWVKSAEKDGDGNDKGIRYIKPIVEMLEKKGIVATRIFHSYPHFGMLAIKREADIGVSDALTNSYNVTMLEELSQGLICFGNMSRDVEKVFRSIIVENQDELPFKKTNKDTLFSAIQEIVSRPEYMEQMKHESREWIEKNWAPERMVKYYEDIYTSVLKGTEPGLCKTWRQLEKEQ